MKGRKRIACSHPGCTRHGFLYPATIRDLANDGIQWMCAPHDEARVFRENARRLPHEPGCSAAEPGACCA